MSEFASLCGPSRAPRSWRSTPTCPARARVAGLAKVHKLSSNESPLGPSPRAIEAFRANADQLAIYPDGSSRLLREAIGQALRPRRRADHLRQRLRRAAVAARPRLSAAGRRRALQPVRLPRISDRHPRRRRRRRSSPTETRRDGQRRRAARQGDGEDQDRLPRQSQQPDRHLSAVLRGQAPARRPARRRAAGARRGLCRICRAQRLRGRRRAGLDQPTTSS